MLKKSATKLWVCFCRFLALNTRTEIKYPILVHWYTDLEQKNFSNVNKVSNNKLRLQGPTKTD